MVDSVAVNRVAVVGASGLVGSAVVGLLADEGWAADDVVALASPESVGQRVDFGDTGVWVDNLDSFDFSNVRLAIIAIPGAVTEAIAARALAAGCQVVNCFSGATMTGADRVLPLESVAGLVDHSHVQLPHPAALMAGMVLQKLKDAVYIQQVRLTAMQPVSSFGRQGMKVLAGEAVGLLSGKPADGPGLGCQLAFNLITGTPPLADASYPDAKELAAQIKANFGDDMLPVEAAMVTVPVFFGTACRLEVETSEPLDVQLLSASFEQDEWFALAAPGTSVIDAVGGATIVVSDMQVDEETSYRLSMWLLTDNVKTAAAKSAVAVTKILLKNFQ